MYKGRNKVSVNLLLKVLVIAWGVFAFVACEKSSPADESSGSGPGRTDANLVSLSVKKAPDKTGYYIGQDFSNTGLVVEGKYDDGTSLPMALSELTFTGFKSDKPNPGLLVKIGYGNLTVDLPVQIYPFEVDDDNVITNYAENAVSVVIPLGVKGIADDVFVGKSLESITFPETLKEIGQYAFFSCSKLVHVTLPSSLHKVGEGVFDNCASLVSADLSRTGITEVSDYMFSRCPKLSEVKLPLNTVSIGGLAFNGAVSLKSINIPVNTRFIGLDAFRESGLESISLPNNMKVIRQRAFWGCASLAEVTTYGNYTPSDDDYVPLLEYSSFQNVPALKTFEIPLGITVLDQTILSNCPLLAEITIPATVTRIGFNAFGNTVLKKVIMLSATPPVAVPATGTTAWNAFPQNTSIQVPSSALGVYKQAFGWNSYAGVIAGY